MMHASRLIKGNGKKGILNTNDVLNAIEWMKNSNEKKEDDAFQSMYA